MGHKAVSAKCFCFMRLDECGATCTVCSVSHYWSKEQKNEKQNNAAGHKNNEAAGYLGPVITERAQNSCRPTVNNASQTNNLSTKIRDGPLEK